MEVVIIDRNRQMPPALRERILDLAHSRLHRFAPKIRRASIVMSDENGPKGGADQRCRLSVRLQSWGEYVIDSLDFSIGRAVSNAVDRMERVLARSMERRRSKRQRLPMGSMPPRGTNRGLGEKEPTQ